MKSKPANGSPGWPSGELPAWALAGMIFLACVVTLGGMLGSMPAFSGAMVVILTDGIMAALVLVAAGGYGYAVFRLFAPDGAPRLLGLATAAGVGLWLLSSVVLIVGSGLGGTLNPYVWWPVVGAGVAAALWQAHRPLARVQLPGKFSGGALVWVLVAVACGIWLAGATMPPGWLGRLTMDSYDVLEYHLQLPREYYQAGHVQTLHHNIYSHYPLGVEMLFLLGMCLRGGAYEGMYLAKLMSGMFGVVAVAGAFGGLRGQERPAVLGDDFRARAGVVLLATAPWAIYLSWLAVAEPAQICYLALGLLWLRHWLRFPSARAAGWIGAMLGAACAVKYLSVGLIAGPVLAVMLAVSVRQARRLRQVALAGGLTVLLCAPWLIRNAAATGNPVFPLASSVFGSGRLSEESAMRWRDAHAPGYHPPVPVPPNYEPPGRQPSRRQALSEFFLGGPARGEPVLGAGVVLLLVGTLVGMFLRPRRVGAWDWALLGVVALQVGLWTALARAMPGRFISVSVVPISLLCAGGLARLACVREVRWLRQSAGLGGRWGLAPAGLLLLAAAAMNLVSAGKYYRASMGWWGRLGLAPAGWPGVVFARQNYRHAPANGPEPGARLLLVGEARAFYFPAGTIYATVFDDHPLQQIIRRGDPSSDLAAIGVRHVLVAWHEMDRLGHTYGWPAALSPDRLRRAFARWPVVQEFPEPAASAPAGKKPEGFTIYSVPSPAPAPASGMAPG